MRFIVQLLGGIEGWKITLSDGEERSVNRDAYAAVQEAMQSQSPVDEAFIATHTTPIAIGQAFR